jgi:hypothetical protein
VKRRRKQSERKKGRAFRCFPSTGWLELEAGRAGHRTDGVKRRSLSLRVRAQDDTQGGITPYHSLRPPSMVWCFSLWRYLAFGIGEASAD